MPDSGALMNAKKNTLSHDIVQLNVTVYRGKSKKNYSLRDHFFGLKLIVLLFQKQQILYGVYRCLLSLLETLKNWIFCTY